MQYLIPKFIFGNGTRKHLAAEAAPFAKRTVLLHSASLAEKRDELLTMLPNALCIPISCAEEPTAALADEIAAIVRDANVTLVVAAGGGAVMDLGKIAAMLATNGGTAAEYAEGVGTRAIEVAPLPFLALPTTAGTGSEMTKNGVISLPQHGKRSIRSDRMLARTAIVDPELTHTVPPAVTAASGADALCQLIEGYTTSAATPYTDSIALGQIAPTLAALPRAVKDGSDSAAREALSLGAAVSGICIANAGLGLVHGIAGILGGLCSIRHGICCGILLPHVVRFNAQKGVAKYADIAATLGCPTSECAGDFLVNRLFALNREIGIPADLRNFHIAPALLDTVCAGAANSGGTKKNPVPVSEHEIHALLSQLI